MIVRHVIIIFEKKNPHKQRAALFSFIIVMSHERHHRQQWSFQPYVQEHIKEHIDGILTKGP